MATTAHEKMVGKEPWHQSDLGRIIGYIMCFLLCQIGPNSELWLTRGDTNRDEILDACFTRLITTTCYSDFCQRGGGTQQAIGSLVQGQKLVVLSPNYHLVTPNCICRLGVSIPLVAARCNSDRGGGGGLRNKQYHVMK